MSVAGDLRRPRIAVLFVRAKLRVLGLSVSRGLHDFGLRFWSLGFSVCLALAGFRVEVGYIIIRV